MNYQLKSSSRQRGFPVVKIAGGAAAIVVLVVVIFWPGLIVTVATGVVSPLWRLAGVGPTAGGNGETGVVDVQVKALTDENTQLKEILGRVVNEKSVLAAIVRRPPMSPYDTLIIDAGDADAVKVNDLVYAYGNILIGMIVQTEEHTSKVRLFSSPGEKYMAVVHSAAGKASLEATTTGRGGGVFEIILARDSGVAVGDSVTIPNINPSIFGLVTSVIAEPARAFSTILFTSPVNMAELNWVTAVHP